MMEKLMRIKETNPEKFQMIVKKLKAERPELYKKLKRNWEEGKCRPGKKRIERRDHDKGHGNDPDRIDEDNPGRSKDVLNHKERRKITSSTK
jgi:hypothetical protein